MPYLELFPFTKKGEFIRTNLSEATPPEDSSNSINPDKPDPSLVDTPSTPSSDNKPITSKPDISNNPKSKNGAYTVTKAQWDYFEEHMDEIPDEGITYGGVKRLNLEEAAKWNQTVQDIMDGKKEVDLSQGVSHEEIVELW